MNIKRLQLLIVEDEEAHVEAIRRVFNAAGATTDIHAVGTLREYRAHVAAHPPDLALLDLNLPDGRAVDVLTHPPEDAPFPILVMTAFGTQQIVVEVMKAGALDYVVKSPETFASIPHAVERVLREWALLQGRKRAEEVRDEALSRLQKIANQVPGVVYQYRLRPDGTSCLPFASEAIRELFRVSPEDVCEDASKFLATSHPDDHDARIASVLESARNLTPWHHEYRVKFDDGTVRWLLGNSLPQREADGGTLWHGFITDITARKQAEAALRESEEKHRLLFASAGDAIFIHDEAARILAVNPLACERLGYTYAELLAMTIDQVDSPAEALHALERIVRLREQGRLTFETVHRRKDGSPVSIEVSARRITWDGQPATISICRDITERKKAEIELQNMQKLKSIGTLAGGIAHDFNNIMMGLFANIALAKNELPKDHPGYEPLENAEKSMARAIRLTTQLLTFSKGGDPVKENVRLGTLVKEGAQFDLSGSNIMLVHQEPADLWPAKVDRGQIQQVISNLTINARQAMPNGGHLYINLENADIRPGAIPNLQHGKYIKVTVRDEGIGIDPKSLDPGLFMT